jgi:hypothetical protein
MRLIYSNDHRIVGASLIFAAGPLLEVKSAVCLGKEYEVRRVRWGKMLQECRLILDRILLDAMWHVWQEKELAEGVLWQ